MQRVCKVNSPLAGLDGVQSQLDSLVVLDGQRRVLQQGAKRSEHLRLRALVDTAQHPLQLQDNCDRHKENFAGSVCLIHQPVDDLDLAGIVARQNAHQQVRIERPHRFLTDTVSTFVEAGLFFVSDTETDFPLRASRMTWSFALILVAVTPRKSRRLPDFGRMMILPSCVVVMMSESPSFKPVCSRTLRGTSTKNLPVVLLRLSTVDPLVAIASV